MGFAMKLSSPAVNLKRGAKLGAAAVLFLAMCCGTVSAQQMGGGGMGGGGQGGGGQGGGGGAQAVGGIAIDPQGVLRTLIVADPALANRRREAVTALDDDLRTRVPLRHVAVARLERQLAAAVAAGHGIPDEMQKLAGLTKVQYVFVYPGEGSEPGEIVLA